MRTLLLFLLAWSGSGVAVAVLMWRRGHNLAPWVGLGATFGPFAAALAFDAATREGGLDAQVVASPGVSGDGTTNVLVGCDGSPHSDAAVERVARTIGEENIGRLTLATVLDYDAAAGGAYWAAEQEKARRILAEATERAPVPVAETVILNGRPADALTAYATEQGYDLLVVGARGSGLSRALLGSVAARLSRQTAVPVLLVAADDDDDTTPAPLDDARP